MTIDTITLKTKLEADVALLATLTKQQNIVEGRIAVYTDIMKSLSTDVVVDFKPVSGVDFTKSLFAETDTASTETVTAVPAKVVKPDVMPKPGRMVKNLRPFFIAIHGTGRLHMVNSISNILFDGYGKGTNFTRDQLIQDMTTMDINSELNEPKKISTNLCTFIKNALESGLIGLVEGKHRTYYVRMNRKDQANYKKSINKKIESRTIS